MEILNLKSFVITIYKHDESLHGFGEAWYLVTFDEFNGQKPTGRKKAFYMYGNYGDIKQAVKRKADEIFLNQRNKVQIIVSLDIKITVKKGKKNDTDRN